MPYIFLSILFLILLYFLFAPICLELNSNKGLYILRYHKLASASLFYSNSSVFLRVKIIWWKRIIDLLEKNEVKPKKRVEGKIKGARSKVSGKVILAMIKSFKVNQFYVNIDTGNMPLNGMLYPVFLLGKKYNTTIMINFKGDNEVLINIENNAFRLLKSYLSNKWFN